MVGAEGTGAVVMGGVQADQELVVGLAEWIERD